MKRLLILGALVIAVSSAHAESRDPSSPYTPQQLKEMSTLVFEGTVMEVETNTEQNGAYLSSLWDAFCFRVLRHIQAPFCHTGHFVQQCRLAHLA